MSGSRSRSFVVVSGSELSHRPESEVSEVDVRMGTDVKETVVMCNYIIVSVVIPCQLLTPVCYLVRQYKCYWQSP